MSDTVVVTNARLDGADGLRDVTLAGGSVASITPPGPVPAGAEVVDAAGRAVIAGLVDAHVHLDKAYQLGALDRLGVTAGEGVAGAIEATRQLRPTLTPDDVRAGTTRLLARMAATGTVAVRAHVELDSGTDPATVRAHLESETSINLQLSAFPQSGTGDPAVRAAMERALDEGCTVVGACPYADPDPAAHLDFTVGLAVDRGLPLDLHLDLTDDPARSQADLVLDRVEKAGLAGRVTVGHLTALTAMAPSGRADLLARLAALDVAVVPLPTTDLWLSGASTRGVAPLKPLLASGIRVALGSNNHQNAFTPVGSGGLLRVAWLASLVGQLGDAAGHRALLDAVTATPAGILGLGPWGVAVGSRAPLLVLDATEPLDAVREAPAVAHVVRSEPS